MDITDLNDFPNLFIFDQLRIIDKIISLAGNELNPDQSVLLILSDSLRTASYGGRIEISRQLPDWIKKENEILKYLPNKERKLISLDSLLLKLKYGEKTSVQRTYLNQISELISGCSQSEYSLLVEKLPQLIQESDPVFYCLRLEDKINILNEKLKNIEEINFKPVAQQIVKTLSTLSENEYTQLLTRLPHWVIERQEIFPFLSKLNIEQRESLFQVFPDKIKSNNLIFTLLSLESKLEFLLRQMSTEYQVDFGSANFREFLVLEISGNLKVDNLNKDKLQQWLKSKYEEWLSVQKYIFLENNNDDDDDDDENLYAFEYIPPSLEDVLKTSLYSCSYAEEDLLLCFISFLQELGINVDSLDLYPDISDYYELFFDLGVNKEVLKYLIPFLVNQHQSGDWGSYGRYTETISILFDEDRKTPPVNLAYEKRNTLAIQENSGCVKSYYLLKDVLSSVPNDVVGNVLTRWDQQRDIKIGEFAAIIVYNELPSTAISIELSSLYLYYEENHRDYEENYEKEEEYEADYEEFFIDFDESWAEQQNIERDFDEVENRILGGCSLSRLLDENQAGWL